LNECGFSEGVKAKMKGKVGNHKSTHGPNKYIDIVKKDSRRLQHMNALGWIKRGQVYWADLSPVVGSEQGGLRPVLIISNDLGNRFSPVVNVAPLTLQVEKAKKVNLPTHAVIETPKGTQVVLLEQNRAIDKVRLGGKIMDISPKEMKKVNQALKVVFAL
jgi:mRNA interferase MazF